MTDNRKCEHCGAPEGFAETIGYYCTNKRCDAPSPFEGKQPKTVDIDRLKKGCAAYYKKLMLKDLTIEQWFGIRFAIDYLNQRGLIAQGEEVNTQLLASRFLTDPNTRTRGIHEYNDWLKAQGYKITKPNKEVKKEIKNNET